MNRRMDIRICSEWYQSYSNQDALHEAKSFSPPTTERGSYTQICEDAYPAYTIEEALLHGIDNKMEQQASSPGEGGNHRITSNQFGYGATVYQGHNNTTFNLNLTHRPDRAAFRLIPYSRNEDFIHRPDLVDKLDILLPYPSTKFYSAALWGLGGSGKTQIALNYAYQRCADASCSVLWVHGDTESRFSQDYKVIAKRLRIDTDLLSEENLLEAVRAGIEALPNWVLIVDNADDLELFGVGSRDSKAHSLFQYIPHASTGTVLWTTRDAHIGGTLVGPQQSIGVARMRFNEAEQLLMMSRDVESSKEEEADVVSLLQELQFLPLAISQAGAYMRLTAITPKEYSSLLARNKRWSTLTVDEFNSHKRPNMPNNVLETVQSSITQIRQESETEYKILCVIAYVNNENIPHELITTALKHMNNYPENNSELLESTVTEIIKRLEGYSLIRARPGEAGSMNYEMHKLVQEAIRYGLNMDSANIIIEDEVVQSATLVNEIQLSQRGEFLAKSKLSRLLSMSDNKDIRSEKYFSSIALQTIVDLFPKSLPSNWKQCEKYLAHALRMGDWAYMSGSVPKTIKLLKRVSRFLYDRCRWQEKEQVDKMILRLLQEMLGDNSPDTIQAIASLATTYHNQGRYSDAELLNIRVLDTRRKYLGDKHPDTARALSALSATYYEQGRYDEAESLQVQALDILREVLGENNPATSRALSDLAATYKKLGRYRDAVVLNIRLLDTRRKYLGDKHPDTARASSDLAAIYYEQGRYNEAEFYQVQALDILREVLGDKHPDTARALSNLATTYYKQGRYNKAESLQIQALDIQRKYLRDKHPDTARALSNLAATYYTQGRYDEVESLQVQALDILREVLGDKHPATSRALSDLAATYTKLGRHRESDSLNHQMFDIQREALRDKDTAPSQAMVDITSSYHQLSHYSKGEPLNRQDVASISTILTSIDSGNDEMEESRYGQGMAKTSTQLTSANSGHNEADQNFEDNDSIYTSHDIESLQYIQKIATSFFGNLELPDNSCLKRVHSILPELLRGFALRMGGEEATSTHFEIMKFVHRKRVLIAECFETYYLGEKDDKEPPKTTQNNMSLEEILGMWQVHADMDDPNFETKEPTPASSVHNFSDELFMDDDDERGMEDSAESNMDTLQLLKYQKTMVESTAYLWLLGRVYRETQLTVSEAKAMHEIATKIRQVLYARKENCIVSSKRGPSSCSMAFTSDWNPLAFVAEQEYSEEPDDAVGNAIVIIRCTNGNTEATTCSEYLSHTWPLFGDDFMELVKSVVRSKPGLRCSVTLFDKSKLTAWIEPSGCFTLETEGVAETIVEVGEVYGWITTAIRSAPGEAVAFISPILDISTRNNGEIIHGSFKVQHTEDLSPSTGQCWQELFRNPVVVLGYPVRRREPEQAPGLEFSFATLAMLVGARQIINFCGKVFLKGFCTILVPTHYTRNTVHWHVIFNEDGSRISFTDPRVHGLGSFNVLNHLTVSGIENARHIVGWYDSVRNYAGSKKANYNIGISGLQQPGSQFAFDRVVISAGKVLNIGVTAAIGKKEKPGRIAKASDYHKQLEWIEQRYVVLYDRNDKRAWLIDGLSALLHLVRASLAHRRRLGREVLFSESDFQEPSKPYTGKVAAGNALRNRDNMALKIYEHYHPVTEEETTQGGKILETKQRVMRSWEQFPDLVKEICMTLGMLFDIQTDATTEDGCGIRVKRSPRRHLEGWDFRDVATGIDPLKPKATLLQDIGLGWVDLVRSINAITLFGVDFGEILEPSLIFEENGPVAGPLGGRLCQRWTKLPSANDLLATTTAVISDIRETVYRDSNDNQRLFKISQDIYWHSPGSVFESCHCRGRTDSKTHCDRVQVLLPSNFSKLSLGGLRGPAEPLPLHGAVIFGHSMKFPLSWKEKAGTAPTETSSERTPLSSLSSRQSDSGPGTSITSMTSELPSIQAPTINAVDSKPSAGKKNRNLLRRLFKKVRRGYKSSEASGNSGSQNKN